MKELPLTDLKGAGPSTAKVFAGINIHSVWDLLHYFPRTYNDFSEVTPIAKTKPGLITIKAAIKQAKGRYVRRGMHITEAVASDQTGSMRLLWFNQPYRADALKSDQDYFITGKLELNHQRFSLMNPSVELVSAMPVHTARIVPVYKESNGISTVLIRKTMAEAIKTTKHMPEVLPPWLVKEFGLMDYPEALRELHFPSSSETLASAKRTLGFIEVFELMLASKILKQEIAMETSPVIPFVEAAIKDFVQHLPFTLTNAQRKTVWQVFKDMEKSSPMNRLIEGDVGSGKTVVAAMAAVMAMQAGYQVALLAPTELLARQHAESMVSILKPLKIDKYVGLLAGSQKKSQKTAAHAALKDGAIKFAIGTHALLQDSVSMNNLGLLIIDEQHRFGVQQRQAMMRSTGHVPHVLSMTATPIPRSLALTLYGELDISLLDDMPPGRTPIITTIVSPNSRENMEQHIRKEIQNGHQVYVVCPVITEEAKIAAVSVEAMYKKLAASTFKDYRVGLLHGKLKAEEKVQIMEQFVTGNIDILVATTVIEVGVNVPNATIMVIEGADRFGLAQMHQLRGRVGRSSAQGYCYIVPSDSKSPSKRLRALAQSTNGFKLAEMDLELRGPGAIYGTLQHGALDLRFASLTDHSMLQEVRQAVAVFMERQEQLSSYPELAKRVRLAQAVITLN